MKFLSVFKFNVYILLYLIAVCSCSNMQQIQNVEISGIIHGTYPEKIFLFFEDQYNREDSISSVITNGRFLFNIRVKTPILGRLHFTGHSYIRDFYIDQPELSLYCSNDIRVTNRTDSMNVLNIDSIAGSRTETLMKAYKLQHMNVSRNPHDKFLRLKYCASIDSLTRKNPDKKVSAYIVNQAADVLTIEEYQPLLADLDTSLKNSYEWTAAYESLSDLRKSSLNLTESGMPFISVNLTGQGGETAAIDSLEGKCFVVVCWASWCTPCRRENPLLNSLCTKYSAKGLQIVGVSFDNNVANWKKAIIQDRLHWLQFIDTSGFQGKIASYYGIKAIPRILVLDGKKRFVGDDETFKDLEEQIKFILASIH